MCRWRRRAGRHDLPTLVRQRVFQIACGYPCQDDARIPRHDPLLELICGRLPDNGAALTSQPSRGWRTPATAVSVNGWPTHWSPATCAPPAHSASAKSSTRPGATPTWTNTLQRCAERVLSTFILGFATSEAAGRFTAGR